MAISKRRATGNGFEGGCTIHRATPQEKWRRTRNVTEEVAGNLKEAIKVLQAENTSAMVTVAAPLQMTVQATESKRKSALKKVLNKLGRALNQTADLSEDMHNLQKRLEESERAQVEVSERMEASTSTMHDRVEHYKRKTQETLDRLHIEEDRTASMVKEIEEARILLDKDRKDKVVDKEVRRLAQGHDPQQNEDLRAENEKLKKHMTALKERETTINEALKSADLASANAERYKEVVAKVTADNMVFLMKLKRNEAALSSAQEKLGEMQKEVDTGRAQWLEEASSEIQDVIRSSLSKAESCEAKLQLIQSRQAKNDEEWEEKLIAANEKLAQITASRNWLEKNLIDATEKYRILEGEKSKLVQRYETEGRDRQNAEAESRTLISTLRQTNEELAEVNLALGTSIKDAEAQRNVVLEKEREIKKILADLDKANCDLETQQAVNAALMKKKEEVEWELMAVEAQRARLHQHMSERPSKSSGRSSPLANFM